MNRLPKPVINGILLMLTFSFLFFNGFSSAATDIVEELIASLKDPSPKTRYKAAVKLGELGDPRAIRPLITALEDKGEFKFDLRMPKNLREAEVQVFISMALGDIGSPAVRPLIDALNNGDPWVRRGAINALARINDERVVEPVIKSLHDPHYSIRRTAPKMLGWIYRDIKDERIVSALLLALQDKDEIVRFSAVNALGEVVKKVTPLIRALNDKESLVRNAAIHSLGTIGDESAVNPLIHILETTSDNKEFTLGYVVTALGRIGDLRALQPLRTALDDPNKKRVSNLKRAIRKIEEKHGLKKKKKWWEIWE